MDPLKAIRMALLVAKSVAPAIEKPLMKKGGGEVPHKAFGGELGDETQGPDTPAFRRMARRTAPGMQPTNIIKEKGGQWLSGNVEEDLAPLKIDFGAGHQEGGGEALITPEMAMQMHAERNGHGFDEGFLKEAKAAKALNDWIDTTLKKYIQRDMGTEHDPVRALAERGILHYTPPEYGSSIGEDARSFVKESFPNIKTGQLGKSQLAKNWEGISDYQLHPESVSTLMSSKNRWANVRKTDPWISKLNPDTPIYGLSDMRVGELGFDHLRDELKSALNDQSGLPDNLQLRPESLQRMSVPQAVEHVHKINKWREDNSTESDKRLAFNSATHLHKDYPNSDLAWFELKLPENAEILRQTPNGATFTNEEMQDPIVRRIVEKEGSVPVSTGADSLREALKYEGDTMGHCVGNYPYKVLSGQSRIFSLRNKKTGAPHVTIETHKSDFLPRHDDVVSRMNSLNKNIESMSREEYRNAYKEAFEDIKRNPLINIAQIKGKGNHKPVDRYIPYVQDFVKSGDWGDVGDFHHTDLIDLNHALNAPAKFKNKDAWYRVSQHYIGKGQMPPRYVTQEEFDNPDSLITKMPVGKSRGGSIAEVTVKVDPQKAIRKALMMARGMSRGGQPKFEIMPPKPSVTSPENFTPYDSSRPTMLSLGKAFDEAIAHHLSLSPEERIANSQRAAKAVADHIGRTSNGKPKDLLGKNAKLLKTEKGKEESIQIPDGRGVETTGLALAPAYEQGNFRTCPNSQSCKAECLGKTSGNYFKLGGGTDLSQFKGPRLNSLLKTFAFLKDPHSFAVKLHDEIQAAKDMAAANGNHLGVRLNVLSDINPRVHRAIIKAHPDVTFYDYTKNNTDPIAPNHHYTYSSTGLTQPGVDNPNSNWKHMRKRLDDGDNVAMAFSHKDHLPEFVHDQETGKKYQVIDGDTHDFRPLDVQPEGADGVIIGLRNKKATGTVADAHRESNGFFVHYDPQLKMAKNSKGKPIYERTASTQISPKTGKPMLGDTIPQNRVVNILPQDKSVQTLSNDGAMT